METKEFENKSMAIAIDSIRKEAKREVFDELEKNMGELVKRTPEWKKWKQSHLENQATSEKEVVV